MLLEALGNNFPLGQPYSLDKVTWIQGSDFQFFKFFPPSENIGNFFPSHYEQLKCSLPGYSVALNWKMKLIYLVFKKYEERVGRKGDSLILLVGMQPGTVTMDKSIDVP